MQDDEYCVVSYSSTSELSERCRTFLYLCFQGGPVMAVLGLAARGMQAALIDTPSLVGATLKTGGLGMT